MNLHIKQVTPWRHYWYSIACPNITLICSSFLIVDFVPFFERKHGK